MLRQAFTKEPARAFTRGLWPVDLQIVRCRLGRALANFRRAHPLAAQLLKAGIGCIARREHAKGYCPRLRPLLHDEELGHTEALELSGLGLGLLLSRQGRNEHPEPCIGRMCRALDAE